MAEADAIGHKTRPGHMHTRRKKRRFDEKMSLDNDLGDSSDTNDGETDNEDWTELGLETRRKASLSARSASTEDYRKRSLPYTGDNPARTGIGSLKPHAPKRPNLVAHKNERIRQGQRLDGDESVGPVQSKKDARTSSGLPQSAGDSPSNSDHTLQVARSSSGPSALLTPDRAPNQHVAGAAQPTPMDVDVDDMNRAEPRFSRSAEVDAEIVVITTFDQPIELSMQWPYIKEPDVSKMSCLSGAPAETTLHYQQKALRVYYSENTFECIFHTPLIKV